MRKLVTALVLLFACSPIFGQVLTRTRNYADLGTCNANKNGRVTIIEDASTAGVCGSGGSEIATCWCINGTWESNPELGAIDLSGYAPLAGADFTGPISITLDRGEEGDETLSYATVLGEEQAYYKLDFTDSDGDTYLLRAGQDGYFYGLWMMYEGDTLPRVQLRGDGTLLIDSDADGGAETVVSSTSVIVSGIAILGAHPGPALLPCDGNAPNIGALYFDNNTENKWCYCNGTAFVLVSDDTTACTDQE